MADRRRPRARINGYPIDLVKSEEIKMSSRITDHPSESGQDFTDNIRTLPLSISMECLVSDTPIGDIATDPTRQLDIIELEDGAEATAVPLPSEDAHQRLTAMWKACLPVEVECSKGLFKDCGIEDISEIADASTGGGLSFTIKFKQVRIFENARTQAKVAIQMPTGDPKDLGLSIDKLVTDKNILWRKGKPPGLAPFTVPKGELVGSEIVRVVKGKYLHEDKKKGELTTQELQDFAKDLNRDAAILTRRGIARVEKNLLLFDEKDSRVKKFQEAQANNPGKFVDPRMFGL